MSSATPSVARSAIWNHLGKVADYALMYVVSVLIARGLGVDQYGRYTALISLLHVLLVASSFGLEATLTRHGAGLPGDTIAGRLRFIARRGTALRLLLLLAGFLITGGILYATGWIPNGPDPTVFGVLGAYAVSRALLPLFGAILTARFRTDRIAIIGVIGRLCELGGLTIAASSGLSIPSVLTVLSIAGGIQIMLHLFWNAGYWWGTESPMPMRPVLVFGGVFWMNALVDYFLGRQGDIALLTLIGGDAAATSRYDVSYSLMQAGAMVTSLGLSGVSLAALSRFGADDHDQRRTLYGTLVRINSFLTIPVLGFIFVAAPDILMLLYGEPFAGAAPVLQLLVGARILSRIFAGGENADLLLSMDMVWSLVAIGVISAVVTVLLHAALIPRFSAGGAAVASGLGALVANALSLWRARSVLAVRLQLRSWAALTGVTACAGSASLLLIADMAPLPAVLVKGIVFVVVWYGCALVVRPLDSRDSGIIGRSVTVLLRPMALVSRPGGVE